MYVSFGGSWGGSLYRKKSPKLNLVREFGSLTGICSQSTVSSRRVWGRRAFLGLTKNLRRVRSVALEGMEIWESTSASLMLYFVELRPFGILHKF